MLAYIMSRPHSGSTILDILLGNSPDAESIGQLISDMGKPDNPCSCGATIRECVFWQGVRERVEAAGIPWDEAVEASVGQGHVRRFRRTWRAKADDPAMLRLAGITRQIEAAILAMAGKPVMIDSSKEPTRALFLLRYLPETRLIHLVRDPRGAVGSHYWRLKDKGFYHFLRRDYHQPWLAPFFLMLAAASWTVGNILFELAIRQAPERVLRVRYEDLRDDPAGTLERIGGALGINVAPVIESIARQDTLHVRHLIGGNDVRLEAGLRFDPKKEHSRRQLPRWVEIMIIVLCWPLMRRYGYALTSRRPAPRPAILGRQ